VSNLSFSFRGNDPVREAMHTAFLYHAIRAGMTMGIVNAGQLGVYAEIPKDLLEHVEDVILNRRSDATERLVKFAETVKAGGKRMEEDLSWRKGTVEERRSRLRGISPGSSRRRGGAPAAERPIHDRRAADGRHERRRPFSAGECSAQVVKSARVMTGGRHPCVIEAERRSRFPSEGKIVRHREGA
jgi:5-methyltetrahydrofolate--homocysteine methyltransferase